MLDLLIKDGLIIDGTGNPGYLGAVGVEGDTVRILRGDISSVGAAMTIDAAGRVVCPGFIDIHSHSHSHSALVVLSQPRHEPKVHQGVTTELIGVDVNSYAPFRSPEDFLRFLQLNSGLDGNPPLPGRWSTVHEYLLMYDRNVAINIAYILGNSPIRIGTVGWTDSPASPADLANMRSLIREAMEEGAFGMSTGLDYPPGAYASTDELVELSTQVAALGGIYHAHVRYRLGDRFLDPFREAIEIGRRSGVPVHMTHLFRRAEGPGGGRRLLELIEDARDEGLDVTFDSFPGVYSSTRLLIMFPNWAHDGGPDKLKEVLKSEDARKRLRAEVAPRAPTWEDLWLTNFARPQNQPYEGKSVAHLASARGQHPVDMMCDLLLEENLQTCYVSSRIDGGSVPDFIGHPLSMVGSDALLLGDFPTPRTYGCYPSILAEVREEKRMSLDTAIRKMTSFPAQRLGIPDRGILLDGMKADITIFDPETVSAPATRTSPRQLPVGIEYVIVNGVVVVDQGKHTGALPGRALSPNPPKDVLGDSP